ncbi:MAG TPA: hypothetical protein VK139_07110 [Microbacteriaceae bacterium]|nr:hypothetical protein [Microbacteriaceae bacterium]
MEDENHIEEIALGKSPGIHEFIREWTRAEVLDLGRHSATSEKFNVFTPFGVFENLSIATSSVDSRLATITLENGFARLILNGKFDYEHDVHTDGRYFRGIERLEMHRGHNLEDPDIVEEATEAELILLPTQPNHS